MKMQWKGNWSRFLDFGPLNFLTPLSFRLTLMDWLTPLNYDHSREKAFAALRLKPSAHVLDMACGTGRLLLAASPWLRAGGRLTGIDVDRYGLAFATTRAKKLGVSEQTIFQPCDMRDLCVFGDGSFDAVLAHFAVYVLSSAFDRSQVTADINRILKPGGTFVSVVPNERYSANTLLEDALRLERGRSDIPAWKRSIRERLTPSHVKPIWEQIETCLKTSVFHRYSKTELEREIEDSGLNVTQIEPVYGGCAYLAAACR